jgi:hypothetical protein
MLNRGKTKLHGSDRIGLASEAALHFAFFTFAPSHFLDMFLAA